MLDKDRFATLSCTIPNELLDKLNLEGSLKKNQKVFLLKKLCKYF
jgi:hypothetical protein